MFRHEHRVRFAEVDAAGVMFFSRALEYCHEALEALLDAAPGGAARLMRERDLGTPTVHVRADYRAPLRYGDTAVVETGVLAVGDASIRLRHRISRLSDGEVSATVEHVIVTARMSRFESVPVPPDLRELFARHLVDRADPRAGEPAGRCP